MPSLNWFTLNRLDGGPTFFSGTNRSSASVFWNEWFFGVVITIASLITVLLLLSPAYKHRWKTVSLASASPPPGKYPFDCWPLTCVFHWIPLQSAGFPIKCRSSSSPVCADCSSSEASEAWTHFVDKTAASKGPATTFWTFLEPIECISSCLV